MFPVDDAFMVSRNMHSFCIDNSGYSRSFALRVDRDFEMVAEASDGVKKPIQLAQHTQSAVILLRTAGLNGHEVARQILSVLRKTKVLFVVNSPILTLSQLRFKRGRGYVHNKSAGSRI